MSISPWQIKAVRKATREEKKRKAMALRKKELGALGMHVRLVIKPHCGATILALDPHYSTHVLFTSLPLFAPP